MLTHPASTHAVSSQQSQQRCYPSLPDLLRGLTLSAMLAASALAVQAAPTKAQAANPTPQRQTPQRQNRETTLQTGDVQVTLRWNSADDLDLYVRDPDGEIVSFFNREVPSGGQLDVDANSSCRVRNIAPLENTFWPAGSGVPGRYMAIVELYSDCGSNAPADFTLEVSTYGDVQTYSGTVSSQQESARFPFALPNRANTNRRSNSR